MLTVYYWTAWTIVTTFFVIAFDVSNSSITSTSQSWTSTSPDATTQSMEVSVTEILPTYGPVSGGTQLSIIGNYFENVTSVLLDGRYPCNLDLSDCNGTMLVCKTTRANKSEIYTSSSVEICWNLMSSPKTPSSCLVASQQFQYKPDPIIYSISPRFSFQSVGIPQMISGVNLDSVCCPYVGIYDGLAGGGMIEVGQICNAILPQTTNSSIVCPFPSVQSQTRFPGDVNTTLLLVYLDIDTYSNVSLFTTTIKDLLSFSFFPDPVFTAFTPNPFQSYNGNRLITISGQGFEPTEESVSQYYTVSVGGSGCSLTQVTNTAIICSPTLPKGPTTQQIYVKVGDLEWSVGNISFELSWIDTYKHRVGVIAGVCGGTGGLLLVIIIAAIVIKCRRRQRRKNQVEHQQGHGLNDYNVSATSPRPFVDTLPEEFRKKIKSSLVDYQQLQIGDEIGKGFFGDVHRGVLTRRNKTETVAIKTLTKSECSFDEKFAFLEEATIMIEFEHRNVLSLLAITFNDDIPYVILPFMENGDLKSFVSNPKNKFGFGALAGFALQVAEGMEYLASHNFIHRDLAARNCMVSKDLVVKVGDFGLARDIYDKDYYKPKDKEKPLPFKWMALESLTEFKFTTHSDVWSFGVLMWELMSHGGTPYAEIHAQDVIHFLTSGRRLERPKNTPDFMYDWMLDCWNSNPRQRPTFSNLRAELTNIMHKLQPPKDPQLNSNIYSSSLGLVGSSSVSNGLDAHGYIVPVQDRQERGQIRFDDDGYVPMMTTGPDTSQNYYVTPA